MRSIAGKRDIFYRDFKEGSENLDDDFLDILRSLLTGKADHVPKHLHMLLDAAGNKQGPSATIRWVPYHLSYVLSCLAMEDTRRAINTREPKFSYGKITSEMQELCDSLCDSKTYSGDGWESIFVLFLLVRCLTSTYDKYFVPEEWFLENPKVFYNEPYECKSSQEKLFGDCKNWQELLKGVTPGAGPQLSILFPTNARLFATYDVLVVYSKDHENKSIYGYQLKEGTASTTKVAATVEIEKSFWVQGKSPDNAASKKKNHQWEIADKASIDKFYGESGKHWTPEKWRKFEEIK